MKRLTILLLLSACGDNVQPTPDAGCDPFSDRACGAADAAPSCPRLNAGVVYCADVSPECLEYAHGPNNYGLTCPATGLPDSPCACETATALTWCWPDFRGVK